MTEPLNNDRLAEIRAGLESPFNACCNRETCLSLLARLDKAEAGWSIEALLSAYEAHTRALPLGAASREKGDSAYNWRMSVFRDLRDLATLPPPPSSES